MNNFLKDVNWRRMLLFVVIGSLMRWLYLVQFSTSPLFLNPIGPDVREYHDWAREIIALGLPWDKVHIHAPLYPMFLAALYRIFTFDLLWVRIVQLLCGMAGIIFCFRAVQRFAVTPENKPEWVALIFAVIALLYPPLIYYQAELVSEALLFTLLCLTTALLYYGEAKIIRKFSSGLSFISVAGLTLGLAAITHPMALVLGTAETLWLLLYWIYRNRKMSLTRRVALVTIFLASVVIVIAPVSIYNSYLAKRPILIQKHSGFNFYLGNNPDADGTCYLRPGAPWDKFHAEVEEEARQLGIDKDYYLTKQAIFFILETPFEALSLATKKLLYVWNFRELISGADPAPLREWTTLMSSSKGAFAVLGVLAFGGLIFSLRHAAILFAARHFILLLGSFWLAQTLTVVSGRYRVAMYPAFFFFAALCLVSLVTTWDIRAERIKSIIVLLLGCALVCLPRPPQDERRETAEADLLLGAGYFKQGNYAMAQHHLKRANESRQGSAGCFNLLGMIAGMRSSECATIWFEQAIKAAPDEAEGYMNLAVIASQKGNKTRAEKLFRQAMKKRIHEPDLYYNYGYFLQQQGNLAEAERYYKLSLNIAPSYRIAINALGVLYIMTGKPEAAVAQFRRASALEPTNHDVMVNLAVAETMCGNKAMARQILDTVLKAKPVHPAATQLKQRLWR